MAEAELLVKSFIQNESANSGLQEVEEIAENDDMTIYNLLPTEILSRILAYLPQIEMVRNRRVCKYWKDLIDEHCILKVNFLNKDKFLDRKFQLRIRECKLYWLPPDNAINFTSPQTIRLITLKKGGYDRKRYNNEANKETISRLLTQVKPYVRVLKIDADFEEEIIPQPFEFPELRKLTIKHNSSSNVVNLDILFFHCYSLPLLKTLNIYFESNNWPMMDKMWQGLFNFLVKNRQSIKRLNVNTLMGTDRDEYDEEQGLWAWDNFEAFELPNQVKSTLSNGQLQLEYLELILPPRYISTWVSIIKSQKHLIELNVQFDTDEECLVGSPGSGIPFKEILPGIESSIATLRVIFHPDTFLLGFQ